MTENKNKWEAFNDDMGTRGNEMGYIGIENGQYRFNYDERSDEDGVCEEIAKKLNAYDELFRAVKIYRDLTIQVLPAIHVKDQKTIKDYNIFISKIIADLEAPIKKTEV